MKDKKGLPKTNVDIVYSDTSSDEDEDDDGELALGALDEQVQSTIEAIRNKDPRVYDTSIKFYTDIEEENAELPATKTKEQKPMYIKDYHRKNLLEGGANPEDDKGKALTYQEQQDDLKSAIVKEMHAAAADPGSDNESLSDVQDGFLVKKAKQASATTLVADPPVMHMHLDVESAEKDPEAYLSNFMSTKAWVSDKKSNFQPFESDDEEEEHRAEAFEEAYNLRFEDPNAANEKLMSHARDTAAKYSVRKDELNPRKKKRDVERSRKEMEKQTRIEEKARLRKLRLGELEEKVKMIKEAAGLENENLPEDGWLELLDDAWDDRKWQSAMEKRFGEDYYKGHGGEDNGEDLKKGRMKKPKWKDDIEINDLIADFDSEQTESHQTHNMIDEDVVSGTPKEPDSKVNSGPNKKRLERLERRKIEEVVDGHLAVDESLAKHGKKHAGHFRYRDTSPLSHGLTANDILMAEDSQLNQFAGLKKLAAFRDPDKKRKDKKHLGKKQRLRKWREETFGNEHGPTKALAEVLAGQDQTVNETPDRFMEAARSKRRGKEDKSGRRRKKD